MAERPPHNTKELTQHEGVNWRVAKRIGDMLLQTLEDAANQDPIARIQRPRSGPYMDEAAQDRYEALRSWRAKTSREQVMDSSLILRRELMEQLAVDNPDSMDVLREQLADWQLADYGEAILKALRTAA